MKHLVLALTLCFTFQAQATVTAEQFVSDFTEQTNRRLKFTNQERLTENKRPYCEELSQDQIVRVQNLLEQNPQITVGEFTEALANILKCYPEFFAPLGRKGVTGFLLNTKAYAMDYLLIADVIADLDAGDRPQEDEILLETYGNSVF